MAASATNTVGHYKGRIASLTYAVSAGKRQPDDPELLEARQNLHAANLEAAVLKCLAKAPRPSDEQLQRIAALLRAGGGDHAA